MPAPDRAWLEERRRRLVADLDRARTAAVRLEGAVALCDEMLAANPPDDDPGGRS